MKESGTVNIIGGGIAGLAAALSFKGFGIKYQLFEQQSAITYENVGLGISANIFPILKSWNVLEETRAIGTEIQHLHFVNKKLKYIKSFKMKRPALSVNRMLFYELLKERLGTENIHFNATKTVNDFPEDDIVISADGINSATRKIFYPNVKLRKSHQILWRGISEIKLEKKFKNAYHDFVGNNLRFAIIHTGGNHYSWYAIKEKSENEKIPVEKAFLKTLFSDYHPMVAAVIDQSEGIYFSELTDINPKDRKNLDWFNNKHLMIGDAIHPTTPNMANGACLAMEDAYLLANLLKNDDLNIREIFQIFQKQRTQKIDPIVAQSWKLGKLLHQKNRAIDFFIRMGIAMTPEFLFHKIYANVLVETKAGK